ncbi:uncharacterized protein LW94_659 [Fusarium fujikuroi]|nr:uncharacterized protein LW94_659 [Fusarium fujikuroi]SCO58717.1 uncharacterized protein FFMR_15873 [Fusarium fujikuroi]
MEHFTEDMIWEPKEDSPMISIYPFGQNVQDGIKYTAAMDPRYTVTPIIIIAALWYHYNWYWNHRAEWTIPVGVYFLFCSAQIMLVMCGFPVFMDVLISAAIIFLACGLLASLIVVGLVILGLLVYPLRVASSAAHFGNALFLMIGTTLDRVASAADSFAEKLRQWRVYLQVKVLKVVHSVLFYLNSTPHSPTGGSRDCPRDGPRHRPDHRHEDGPEGELDDETEEEPEDDRIRDLTTNRPIGQSTR